MSGKVMLDPPLRTSDVLAGQSLTQIAIKNRSNIAQIFNAGLLGMFGHYAAERDAAFARKAKIMESQRMKRTADAKAMSKKTSYSRTSSRSVNSTRPRQR